MLIDSFNEEKALVGRGRLSDCEPSFEALVSMIVMMMMMLMMTQGVPGNGGLDPGAAGGQLRCAQDEEMRAERCNIVPTTDLQTIQRIIVLDRFSNDNLLILVRSFLLNSMY